MVTFFKSFSTTIKVLILFLMLSVSLSLSSQVLTKPDNDKDPVKDTPTQGSKDSSSDTRSDAAYEPRDIADAFAPNAVTLKDMELRAKYHAFVPQEIVVAMQLETSRSNAALMLEQYNWQELFGQRGVELNKVLMKADKGIARSVVLVHLSLPEGVDVFTAMKKLEGKRGILWSSPNFIYDGDPREFIPNDPSYASQYHHPLMQNNLAWDITLGSPSIIVAITDDGVELTHSDLAPNIWVNTGEIAGDGIDNDGNGYIDDVNGWDFSNGNNNPNPNQLSHNHGTHVAGITAARTNNSIGVAGVSGHSTIMPLQFYNYINWTAAMINETFTYAADNGAKIVNTSYNIDSWVGDPVFTAGLQYLYDAGVLHINSAGNNNQLNPPRQVFHQTLLVASTDASDVRSSFSNYGNGVDISAPGSLIYSTVTGNSYDYNSGTSMAAPNAAGAAALIWSANPTWTRDQVAAQLLATADNIDAANPTLIGLLGTGRVNTYAALTTVLAAPQVKSTVGLPEEGTIISTIDLTSFSVAFDQVMNPVTVNNLANFELRNAGLNEIFGDGDDVVYSLTTTTTYRIGTNQMTFQISDLPLQCGLHRLTLVSGGLENPFGTDLDGDENGVGGDDYVRNFSVVDAFSYFDGDGDGYGAGVPSIACIPPPGYVLLDGDCDDNNPLINPGATEVCDGVDNNCDGIVDFPEVATYPSTNVPVAISASGTPTVSSTIIISGATGNITDLNIKDLNILHSWVGDLKATLTSPGGTVLVLFDRAGHPGINFGCAQNNILATFDDEAALTADDFENTCNSSNSAATYAISGSYQSIDPLVGLIGTDPNGTWILTISDFANGDGGSLEGWGLEITIPAATATYYVDADGDGYGDPLNSVALGCTPAAGFVPDNTDCDDTNPNIKPGATEVCDGVDNNCNGQIDEGGVCCTGNTIYFVNDDAVGLNDGSSWTDAFTDLQSALNSTCPDITQIWVAAGTYKPTSGTDRNISFVMKNGVAIYGGFEGTETLLSQRNWTTNVTILSGDLLDNDGPDFANNSDNSYHIIYNNGNGLDASAVLDGFTISAGNANGVGTNSSGGAMHNNFASPLVKNCIFSRNSASNFAGGMYNSTSAPNVINCVFISNTSVSYGAAMLNIHSSTPLVINCSFSRNSSNSQTVTNINSSFATLANCIVWNNIGGSVGSSATSGATVTNSIVMYGYTGTGNLNTDPLFVNAASGDLRLQPCSPAINKGTNTGAPSTDLDGNPRPFNPYSFGSANVDMGAYEFSVVTDYCDVCEAVAGTLSKSPDEAIVCLGSEVSATLTAGMFGNGIDELEFRTHDGTSWSAWAEYTSGTAISTAGIAEVEIRTRRLSDNCEPSAYETIGWLIQWPPVAFAGQDASILPGDNYSLSDAAATGTSSILWETSGDGSFDDAYAQNPTYTPGPNDKLTGSVELSISLEDMNSCGFTENDQMTLTIYRPPFVQITYPFEGEIFYNNPVTATGTTVDPDGDILVVYLNVNNGGWELATGTNGWAKELILSAGDNLIQAKAVDNQGLESNIAEVNVILSVQTISIPQGWSLISSYLTPNDPALELVMQDVNIPGNLTIMLGLNGLFWPDYGINTLGNWNVFQGYKVKYQQAVELTISGNELNDNSVTFPEGFHIIPVLSNVPSPISEIFTNPANDLKYMFDLTSGQIYWPLGGITTLTQLTPGKGYLANFTKQVTLNFPAYQALKSSASAGNFVSEQAGPWEYSRTGEVHFISLFAQATDALDQYSHIGAFNSVGDCIGFAGIAEKNQNILLTVYGNDATIENKNGADVGELITFRAYDPSTGRETALEAIYDNAFTNHDGLFALNGLSAIMDFKESSTGIGAPALISQISVYPNPADDLVTISISGNNREVNYTILDVDGKLVHQSNFSGSEMSLNVSDFKPGIYMIRLDIGGEIFTRRLVVM